jgi:hypothetical protein
MSVLSNLRDAWREDGVVNGGIGEFRRQFDDTPGGGFADVEESDVGGVPGPLDFLGLSPEQHLSGDADTGDEFSLLWDLGGVGDDETVDGSARNDNPVSRLASLVADNVHIIAVGAVGLVVVYALGQLVTVNVGDSDA